MSNLHLDLPPSLVLPLLYLSLLLLDVLSDSVEVSKRCEKRLNSQLA